MAPVRKESVVGSKEWAVKEVVGAMSPESGGAAAAVVACAGLRPVRVSQIEAMVVEVELRRRREVWRVWGRLS